MQPLTFRASLTEEDLIATFQDVRSVTPARRIVQYAAIALIFVCGGLAPILGASVALSFLLLIGSCIVAAIALLLDAPIRLWMQRRELRANLDMQHPMVFSFDEHGMTIHQLKFDQRIDWKMFRRFHDLTSCFVLATKSHHYTLPKRWLSPIEQDELRQIMYERLPNKA